MKTVGKMCGKYDVSGGYECPHCGNHVCADCAENNMGLCPNLDKRTRRPQLNCGRRAFIIFIIRTKFRAFYIAQKTALMLVCMISFSLFSGFHSSDFSVKPLLSHDLYQRR